MTKSPRHQNRAVATRFGLYTGQIGGSVSGTLWGGTIVFSGGIAIDSSGNIAFYFSGGGGLGVGASISATVDALGSDAVNVQDLAGPFSNLTIGAGDGVDAAYTVFGGDSPDGTVHGTGGSVGAGVGATGSVTVTGTKVCDMNCIMDFVLGHPRKNPNCRHHREFNPISGGPID